MASGGPLHNDALIWRTWVDTNYTRTWSANQYPLAIVHYAFAYALLKDGPVSGVVFARTASDYAANAKALLLSHITPNPGLIPLVDQETVIAAYDWIYPTLSAGDRLTIVNWIKTIDSRTDDGNPFNTINSSVRAAKVLGGIACALDGIDDAWCLSHAGMYRAFFRDTTGVTRSESDLVGDDGGTGQGISYGFGYTMRRVLFGEEGFRTATGASIADHYGNSDTRFLRYQPQHLAYRILPWGISAPSYPGGRKFILEKGWYKQGGSLARDREFTMWLNAVAGLYQTIDPKVSALAQWLITNRTGALTSDDVSILNDWVFSKFIVGPATPPAALSPAALNLPVSRRFQDGRLVFRSNWDDPQSPFVSIYANEWTRNLWGMSGLLPGAFEVHRSGPQVIHQGGISGHDWGGGGNTGSSNILTFTDRTLAAPTNSWDDEGGARRLIPQMLGSVNFVQDSPFDTRDAVRHLLADPQGGRDADYVSVDVTRAYSSTRYKDAYNPARVSEVIRQFVYFSPDNPSTDPVRLIVFDRATTTDTKFEKRWLFHTAGEPMVNGTPFPGPVRGGHGDGHSIYTRATRITATNTAYGSNGRVWLTPLLPASRTVIKIGGPNSAGVSWATDSHEYESPYGERYPYPAPEPEREQYVGRYRIEIIPTTPALSDVFLNVVEVNNAGVASPTPTASLPAVGLVAARVGNRIAAFNRITANVSGGSFTIDAADTYKIHMADLTPGGDYDVTVAGSATRHTASAAGTLYLERTVAAGANVELRATGVVIALPPSAPTGLRIRPGR